MKTFIDRKKVGTRAELSNLASIGGLVLLLASVLLPLFLPKAANFSFLLMVVGLGTAMVGIFYANRWTRRSKDWRTRITFTITRRFPPTICF
jgi:UDP-N-acetylmuramyl pentapeptide phosphotransferase/UDP-N-acetylglucosamine-1-phosphate transferase